MAFPPPPPGPWTSASSPGYSVYATPLPALEALEAGNLPLASSLAEAVSLPPLPDFLISDANRGIWRRRLDLVNRDPEQFAWISRLVVYEDVGVKKGPGDEEKGGVIVGRIGFHGKPDERGTVEVGYEISPEHRRKGHAKAAVGIMIEVARRAKGVNVLKASVEPDNLASRKVVEGAGLKKVGRKVHARRGLEDIFEMDVSQ
ncbi:uncharacterized protein PAC_16381 [Phialocephala subalpina]|uniref:N-acetyltransferase domain-containing protein n=1 Tax=Phialocephala subalpina TaxID=576137 RepID=A0A1L7XN44_9HELO|nr:uncharacterized protein PAC_16381 [Phialocephala subalpina]